MEISLRNRLGAIFMVAESPRLTIHYCSPRDNRPFLCYFNETYASEFV